MRLVVVPHHCKRFLVLVRVRVLRLGHDVQGRRGREQVDEFAILDPRIAVGGRLVSHDAKLRKGKWFVPYIMALDHYESKLHDVSDEGLLTAIKIRDFPNAKSKANAQRILRRLRQDPVEFLGRISPRWALRLASKILPAFLVRRVGQGRN